MNNIEIKDFFLECIFNFYDFKYQNMVNKIDSLNLINDKSILYVKGLGNNEEIMVIYIFNEEKVIMVECDPKENGQINFKITKKSSINNITFSIDKDNYYSVSLGLGEDIIFLSKKDGSSDYKFYYRNVIKLIVDYLIK
ncbi:hypothetical protein [Clostridium sp. YIM B02555]|uniref:hypothetical protein n=1 Tax=Clostridium sp. YIM B02555 TaxID=2911968 RepID=UPI001EEDF6A4|nr:hypothetical protein [Clostridium sp. YIM B02555]